MYMYYQQKFPNPPLNFDSNIIILNVDTRVTIIVTGG